MQKTLARWASGGRRWLVAILAIWLACTGLVASHAQEAPANDRSQLVAQTVFGILSYTRWPEPLSTVRLCVLGPTEFADELLKGGKLSGDRQVLVRRVFADEPKLIAECNAVYAGRVSDDDWRKLLARVASQPLLTISERKALCVIGGMFCLEVQDNSVAFEVNLDSVERSGVKVNPRVLQMGRRKANS